MNTNDFRGISRRKFIRSAGLAAAAFSILPGTLRGGTRLSPNEKLNVAGIGFGSRGAVDIDEVAKLGHNIVAMCDVDEKYAAKEFAKYPNATRFKDYRQMLDKMRGEIDAVIIGTPDHTHAVIAMEAMGRGKHVYCEKPLAHNVHEVRALMAAARKYKVVTQLGNQGHSTDSIRKVCEWVGAGAIGKVHTVHAGTNAFPKVYSQSSNLSKLNEQRPIPAGLDYDLWLGPAEFRPYSPLWVPWNWRGWTPFGSGAIGDWICHVVDPAFWALDLGAPSTVRAEAPGYDPVSEGLVYPAGTKITFEFPAGKTRGPVTLIWHDGNIPIPRPEKFKADDKVPDTGAIIFGDNGMIVHGSHGGSGCYLLPEELMDKYSAGGAVSKRLPRVKDHASDWVEAIRNGREAGSHFGYGGPLTELALLGLIALRFPGQVIEWNGPKASFTNKLAANAWLNPPYRKGWKL